MKAMRTHSGFTLIEVMVALVVLSVGMIGVAALHGRALAASATAMHTSEAIYLAGNMAERIRVNRGAGAAYEAAASDNSCDGPTGGGGAYCTPDEMAANDLFVWQAEIAGSLPGGQGAVAVDETTNPTSYTITVSWDEPDQNAPVSYSFLFQLPIY